MKKVIVLVLLLCTVLFSGTVQAEKIYEESSFRYKNGELIGNTAVSDEVVLFSDTNTLKGIDVSKFQGDIDWEKVKNSGIDFAIIRCGFGDDLVQYDDVMWKENADECTRLGIPFGAYLYSYAASIEEAYSEAAHAIRLLEGYDLSYPIYLDLEDDVVGACSNELIGQIADIFCTSLQKEGYEVGIYANLNWWNNRLTSDVFDDPTRHKWVAQWGTECTYNGEYTMWQYTDNGMVDGISCGVDMNIWYGESFNKDDTVDYSYPNTYINTGNYSDDIVGVAQNQIGYTELTSSDGMPVIDSAIPYYTKYGKEYGNPTGHWCAFFVLWCAKQADIPTSIICKSAECGNCGYFVEWFKSNHRWKDNTYVPQKGDIVFFDWENDGSANHTGIVRGVKDDSIITIEGNTGGENGYMVMEKERNKNILGYGVPDYGLQNKINGYANAKYAAYMLPDSASATVWEIWQNDELQVLCRDGDYYLVLYPYEYTGKFVAAYVPVSAVNLQSDVPYANEYYALMKHGIINEQTTVYHNASCDDLMGRVNNKVRATLNGGEEVEVLFEEGDFLFIRTESLTGYIQKDAVIYQSITNLRGDVNGDGKIDSADSGLILRYDIGLLTLTDNQIMLADINSDGKVDSADAGLILRFDAGLISKSIK